MLCPKTILQPVTIDTNCNRDAEFVATLMAEISYQNLIDSLRQDFTQKYLAKCLGSMVQEEFTLNIKQSEYHYTLYYYDQAGNLVKTIPPAGVVLLDATQTPKSM